MKGEDAAGVLLTIKSRLPETGSIVVNLSSWYVEPSCRWFAPRMLQMASSSEEELFTDLTPSPEACKLNERLGFQTVTDHTLFYPLPLKALRPSGARLSPLAAVSPDTLPAAMREMLEDHLRLGCIVAIMQADGHHYPLVFLKTTTKKLPSARLIYCEDREIAQRHISAIARHLLFRGRLALTMAALDGERNAGGFAAHKFAPIQVKAHGTHILLTKHTQSWCYCHPRYFSGAGVVLTETWPLQINGVPVREPWKIYGEIGE